MSNTNKTLDGKVAVVTGGSRGIGRAISLKLARMGALVAINYAGNEKAFLETKAQIENEGGQAFGIKAALGSDTSASEVHKVLLDELDERAMPHKVDILVNNAGIGMFAGFEQSTMADFDNVFGINVRGTFSITQTLIHLIPEGGRIINLSSGLSRRPETQTIAYSMTKAALDVFTIALAKEYGPKGITVNAVAPGWTHTEANDEVLKDEQLRSYVTNGTPLGRLGKPDDIANTVSWLATEEAKWVTGQWLESSGGFGL